MPQKEVFMDVLRDMLIRNGLIGDDGSYLTDALISNQICICDRSGRVTHRIEKAVNGVDLVVRNTSTHLVDLRLRLG
ncbi:hypothetical protein IJH27_00840 [Candidatus Saccharibacteria bacterium]|nr:hypothetical protein [Candidatus Saccharibacteria bacterium]